MEPRRPRRRGEWITCRSCCRYREPGSMSSSSTNTCDVCAEQRRAEVRRRGARGEARRAACWKLTRARARARALTRTKARLRGQSQLEAAKVLEVILGLDERDARVVVRMDRLTDLVGHGRGEEADPDVGRREGLRAQAVDLLADGVP
eukprot:scaffold119480_cov60-Phaeocystis_antarctica.AAC.2